MERNQHNGLRWAIGLAMLAVVAIVFGALPAMSSSAALSAQCYVCDDGDCDEGGGGASCQETHEGGSQTCTTEGGCEYVKIKRWWIIPDGQACTPQHAAATDLNQTRHATLGGTRIALQAVGESHYAAVSCTGDVDWDILAWESPSGDLTVTTNAVVIGYRRWRHELRSASDVLEAGDG